MMTSRRLALLFGGAAMALAAGAPLSGQQQRPPEVRPPAGSQTVAIDFQVLTGEGLPIADLKADEVTVRIDGKARPVKSLEFVQFSGAPASGAAEAGTALPPAFGTNTTTDSPRAFVLVVDDESIPIGQERGLRAALNRFVDELPARDRAALVTVPHGGIKVDLTSDRDRLHAGIAAISPIAPSTDARCQARDALRTLMNTMDSLSTGEQPVIVAYFSASMVGPSQLERDPGARTAGAALSSAAGSCFLQPEDFQLVGESAAAARVQLYVIHPDYSQAPAREGIENLRGVTGASLLHLTSGNEPGLTRMARETSAYYLATVDVLDSERGGGNHQISIRVSRSDTVVRSRPNLTIPKPDAATGAAAGVPLPRDMVRSARTFRTLPIRVAGFAARNPGGDVRIIGLLEPVDPAVKFVSAAAGLFDAGGKLVSQWTSEPPDLTARPVALAMVAPPGRYRLRVAAVDTDGRTGAAEYEINAELTPAGPMTLSSLVLGLSRGAFVPRLQFSTEASAIAYMEIYGGAAGAQVGVIFEVAKTVDGAPMMQVPAAAVATSEEGRVIVTGTIPVGALPPGDYVVRALVGVSGQPAGRVIHTLHKEG